MIRSTIPFAIALACAPLSAQAPAAAPDSIYPVSGVEVRPEALNGEELGAALFARYPAPLKAAGVSGEVTVSMVVGPDGVPRNVELVTSTDTLFNTPTLEVASLLRFSPAQMGGRPVPVRIILPVPWQAGPAEDAPGPDAAGAYTMDEVEREPRPTNAPVFQRALLRLYPRDMVNAGTGATVQVRLLVDEEGMVRNASITRSANAGFDNATLTAVQVLRFRPATVGGRPVKVWVDMPVEWLIIRELIPPEPGQKPIGCTINTTRGCG